MSIQIEVVPKTTLSFTDFTDFTDSILSARQIRESIQTPCAAKHSACECYSFYSYIQYVLYVFDAIAYTGDPPQNYTGGRACRCTPLLFLFHSTPAPPPECLPARVCCACKKRVKPTYRLLLHVYTQETRDAGLGRTKAASETEAILYKHLCEHL